MPRPRTVDPHGNTRIFSVMVSDSMHERLRKEAEERGMSLGAVVREKLEPTKVTG